MLSMTGFGSGEGTSGQVTVSVELRSVNHRFLDVSFKLPGVLGSFEPEIRQFLKENSARGRVTVSAQMSLSRDNQGPKLDQERLSQGLTLLQEAAAELEKVTGHPTKIKLDHLLAVPEILRGGETEIQLDEVRPALLEALQQAHVGLMKMKEAEGDSLVIELKQRLETIAERLEEVAQLAPQAAVEIQAKLEERLTKLLDTHVDPQRLAQEVALLADKGNINEECERLQIHLDQFAKALDEGGQVAKRLNFLLQEMHREVNTMGSKTGIMAITQSVIVMKDEVESLREQIMNLE
jgi:uncharacterized protein (TIGR00255 family)